MDDRGNYIFMYNLNINKQKQNRHICDSPDYIEGRSILTADPETLVDLYAGKGTTIIIDGAWNNKERFTHTDIIGVWKSFDGNITLPTNRGILHYSYKKGVHIVPANPQFST